MKHTIKRFRYFEVVCKQCGHSLGHYPGNPYWHFENPDMSHRGLVLDHDVVESVEEAAKSRKWRRNIKSRRVVV